MKNKRIQEKAIAWVKEGVSARNRGQETEIDQDADPFFSF